MKIPFTVHSANEQTLKKTMQYQGEDIPVDAKVLEVDLISNVADHGTLTLRFLGKAALDAVTIFQPGKIVIGEFTQVSG